MEDESSNQRPENRFFSSLVLLIGLVQIRTFERGSNFIVAALTLVVLRHELLSPAVPDPKRAIIKAKVMCWIWNNGGWGTKPLRREWVHFVGIFLKESGVLQKKRTRTKSTPGWRFFVECYARFVLQPMKFNVTCSKKGLTLKYKYVILDETREDKNKLQTEIKLKIFYMYALKTVCWKT